MSPARTLSRAEFIALIAMMFAMVAFSIDAMLPALPQIAADISPGDPNRAQLVVTSFVLGMGIGTFFAGPLSDAFGRKPVILAGAALYISGALWAALAGSVAELAAARILQGLGVAAPRIVSMAIIRDLYQGRVMAQIVSIAMLIFAIVPAIAPSIGALIIAASGWRAVFVVFVVFCLVVTLWLALRQPETHQPEDRTPFRIASLLQAARTCFSHPVFIVSAIGQSLIFAVLFGNLSSVQPIFDEVYGKAASFPFWFAVIAVIGGSASLLNARLVIRLGMARMVLTGFFLLLATTTVVLILLFSGPLPFAAFVVWQCSIFFVVGFVIGNLNALAMEPLGRVAGMAASILGGVATVTGASLAIPIGYAFDQTPIPLASSIFVICLIATLILTPSLKGRLNT